MFEFWKNLGYITKAQKKQNSYFFMYAEDLVTCQGDWEILVPYPGDSCPYTYTHLLAGEQYFSKVFTLHTFMYM